MEDSIIICACRNRGHVDAKRVDELLAEAKAKGARAEMVDDLCSLLANGTQPALNRIQGATVAACHERAVKSLLRWRGVEAKTTIDIGLDQRTTMSPIGAPTASDSDAWYPTIDKDRCTECGACLDFCPFGVYEWRNDRVTVVNPSKCKNNCPSCARNCPQEAIIFPKYERSPINGGEERQEQAMRVDHSQLYADTLRSRLIARRQQGTPLFKHKDPNT